VSCDFPRYYDSLSANGSEGWLAFSWELIATLEKYGGNVAVCDGIDMAQLRLEHQTQGHFNRIIPEQFKIHSPRREVQL
jgi:hypothetical protein